MEPTTKESISKLSSVLSTILFEKKGEEIKRFIEENPVEGEHPYEAAFRLGLAVMFSELLDDKD